jgi:hypothetical protein
VPPVNRIRIATIAIAAVGLLPSSAPAYGWQARCEEDRIAAPRREPSRDRPGPSPESSIPIPILETPGEVRAGDRVLVRWGRFGRDVEELELLLSIDAGRRYTIRISPELEGAENRYVWRVPNLGAHDARVRIRARLDGREVNGRPSASFTMVQDRGRPRERWLFDEGGSGVEREIEARGAWGLAAATPGAAFDSDESEPLSEAPPRSPVPEQALRYRPCPTSDALLVGAPSRPRARSPPRTCPLRE